MNELTENKKGITIAGIKMIAVITMLIDHVAYVLVAPMARESGVQVLSFGNCINSGNIICILYIIGRLIGRVSFLLYCFCLVEGFRHTKNRARYGMRLLVFALISEIPFNLAIKKEMICLDKQNVIFTLLLGFIAIWIIDVAKNYLMKKYHWTMWYSLLFIVEILVGASFGYVAELARVDYGFEGVVTIVIIYTFMNWGVTNALSTGAGSVVLIISNLLELTTLVDILIIRFYKGEKGKSGKVFFYLFYPVHLAGLYLIYRIIY